ncbi:MAG TPA: DUF5615 family PIN-like protein [Gemmataceae bacterium]|nr:DUF5615 family PIN-like protein [Gemmataceae bacterium]
MTDDSVDGLLIRLLQRAGHDVAKPADFGISGTTDPRHLWQAIDASRVLLSKNHDDFDDLHRLIMKGHGHHPGILIVRKDNDPTKDMQANQIVRAIGKLEAAGTPIVDEFIILNQWR